MINIRRQDIGLGKTAGGGSGGSFASHGRAAAAPPPAIETEENLLQNANYLSQVPNFAQIMEADPEQWMNTPWAERKKIVERATREIIAATPEAQDTPFGTPLTFGEWKPLGSALARNAKRRHMTQPELNENTVQMNASQLRTREPQTIANTILHEVAHGIDDWGGGHGERWAKKHRMLLDRHGMTERKVEQIHWDTDREHAARMVRKIVGTCQRDPTHISYRDGMPRSRMYICTQGACRGIPQAERLISYARNPQYIG